MIILTKKQTAVLAFIKHELNKMAPFPSLTRIASQFGFSRNTAKFYVQVLKKKGMVTQREQRVSPFLLTQGCHANPSQFALMARVPAGGPDMVDDQKDRFVSFDQNYFGPGELKAIQVSGESMSGDAICDGDVAIVRIQKLYNKNDIVAVHVAGEGITLKRLRPQKEGIDLVPSNPAYRVQTFAAEQVAVVGKVVGMVRKNT